MKYLFLITTVVSLSLASFAQNKYYTKGYENGHLWIDASKESPFYTISKSGYLGSMLGDEKIKEMAGIQSDPLFCYSDINLLKYNAMSNEILLDDIVDLMDDFYSDEFNLVIPIRYAYCYAIKKVRDVDEGELRKYKVKLLVFSYSD